MDLFTTEAFGPVVAISKFSSLDEAISLANDSDYGLSATIITQNIKSYLNVLKSLKTGMLHVNGPSLQDG